MINDSSSWMAPITSRLYWGVRELLAYGDRRKPRLLPVRLCGVDVLELAKMRGRPMIRTDASVK